MKEMQETTKNYNSMGEVPTEVDTPTDGDTPMVKPVGKNPKEVFPGDVLGGRYVVMCKLGEGGMGVVYKCFDKLGGVEVAVKGLPPEVCRDEGEMEEIRANYQIVGNLHHQNIAGARTLDKDESTGGYYLVMDLVSGMNLKRWMRHNPHVSMEVKLSILRQVAAALDYAHSQKVIHRDVKPENVMVDDEGCVKVLDFGLAAQICSSQSRTRHAETSRSGTPGYKSPEQWLGYPQRASADVYSFGVLAYWMFAGELPFDGDDLAILGRAVLTAPVRPVAGISRRMNAALTKALAKKPEKRFSSCREVVDALEGRSTPQGGSSQVGWRILVVVLLVVLTAAGYIGYTMLKAHDNTVQSDPPDPQPPHTPPAPPVAPPKPTPPHTPPAPLVAPPKPTPPPTPPAPPVAPPKPTPPPTPSAPQPPPKPTPPYTPPPPPVTNKVTTVSDELNGDKVFRFPSGVEMRLKKCKAGANMFWMGETEVSVGQWRSVMLDESFDAKDPTNDYPKTQVSLKDCREFMGRLKDLTGEGVSLPDTNSWVTACLAGKTTAYWWGNEPMTDIGKIGGHFARKTVNAVGSKDGKKTYPPNSWGLYDMHGNVAEWCNEGFLFGGGYKDAAAECKASSGYKAEPDFEGDDNTGFRVFINGGE